MESNADQDGKGALRAPSLKDLEFVPRTLFHTARRWQADVKTIGIHSEIEAIEVNLHEYKRIINPPPFVYKMTKNCVNESVVSVQASAHGGFLGFNCSAQVCS